jgi:hypothetical protein
MMKYRSSVAVVLALALVTPAVAQEINPIESRSVQLEGVAGDVYYTVRPDGYHLVATFAPRRADGTPFRFETVLAPGQSVTVSTPRGAGDQADAVEISRRQDRVYVQKAAALVN